MSDEYFMPSELNKNNINHIAFKVTNKLKADYFKLCQSKGVKVSKRLRNFMIYELKKEETSKVKPIENVELEKPKGLNTDVSVN